jgi:hypothetical protein
MLDKISTAFRNAPAVLKSKEIVPSFAGSTVRIHFRGGDVILTVGGRSLELQIPWAEYVG